MTRTRNLITGLLLLLVAAIAVVPVLPAQAGATIAGCGWFNCNGGPDQCVSISISVRGVAVSVTCYTLAPKVAQ